MKTPKYLCAAAAIAAGATVLAADVRLGLVSYWPLDEITADWFNTVDVVSNYDLVLVGIDPSMVVAGKRGNAIQFDGTTTVAYRTSYDPDERLPVSKSRYYTVMFWVKGAAGQSDRRVFSESNCELGDNDPLVNIGTHNTGADGTVDLFFRNSTAGVQLNHIHSPGTAYDGTWHHVALVEANGALTLYIDGVVDLTRTYAREANPIQDTTSIGGIVRGAGGSNIGARFAGTIDEVAIWERALTQAEVQDVMNNGIATPVPALGPFVNVAPVGADNLRVGDRYTLTAAVGGVRPLTYQWLKGGEAIADATATTLTLTGLQTTDSGEYLLRAENTEGAVEASAALVVSEQASSLTNQVVALWRLDEVQGTKTPDLVNSYDMTLVNLSASDLVAGKWGNCMHFDAARQTMLSRIDNEGELLPINQFNEFSVSLWVKGVVRADDGTILQTDRRVFSEGWTTNTTPLFNIGTHNSSTAPDGTVDTYIRSDGNVTSDHQHTVGVAFDGVWHHILYTQQELGGSLVGNVFIDGVLDANPARPVRPLTLNTTTIGGILRNTASAWYTGEIDDVVVWQRALTAGEAMLLATEAMPTPPANLPPLAVASFSSSMPSVVQGDSVVLAWDVSKSATQIVIDNGVGDVTASTTAGAGTATVTPAATTTYKLTVKRGTEEVTANVTITVLTGVAANWTALDTFDEYAVGPLAGTGWWSDTGGSIARIEDLNGNRLMRTASTGTLLPMGSLEVTEGQERTLFFRMLVRENPTSAFRQVVGLTDKNIRNHGDADDNIGPAVHPNFDTAAPPWFLGVIPGVGGTIEYAADPLETGALYAIWIDIKNTPLLDPLVNDVFSVYIKKDGDAERTLLFQDYMSDRDPVTPDPVLGPMMPNLNKLIVTGNNAASSIWFDDFFISKSGYNATEPAPFNTGGPPTVAIAKVGGEVEVTWSGGALEAAGSIMGPWDRLDSGITSPYRPTLDAGATFYRVVR
ncbi:MAG TPA: LamG domain-containing protein [Verrucomicrobiota bacterium]|nr:LamG domain-containing protein [Verrucomicrobiota bacterium]HNU50385.1 LamG domain-containing protein [Verrucomicrobiota bacterium]